MTKAVQFRRGSTAKHGLFTGLSGEITVDTDKSTGVIHDNKTVGGMPLAREDLENVELQTLLNKGLTDSNLSNVSDEVFTDKGIVKTDLSNVDTSTLLAKGLLKNDLSNCTQESYASSNKRGVISLATKQEAIDGQNTDKAITPHIYKETLMEYVGLPPRYIEGLLVSNLTTNINKEIVISKGRARDYEDTCDIVLKSPISKKLNLNFEKGTTSGGLAPNMVMLNNQVYYVFVLLNPKTMEVDAGFDTDKNAVNLIKNSGSFTKFRRVGIIKTDSTGNILQITTFEQAGGAVRVFTPKIQLDYQIVNKNFEFVDIGFGNLIRPILSVEGYNFLIEMRYHSTDPAKLLVKTNPLSGVTVVVDSYPVNQDGGYYIRLQLLQGGALGYYLHIMGFIDERN